MILWYKLIPFHHANDWDHSTGVSCIHQIYPCQIQFIEYVISEGKMTDKK